MALCRRGFARSTTATSSPAQRTRTLQLRPSQRRQPSNNTVAAKSSHLPPKTATAISERISLGRPRPSRDREEPRRMSTSSSSPPCSSLFSPGVHRTVVRVRSAPHVSVWPPPPALSQSSFPPPTELSCGRFGRYSHQVWRLDLSCSLALSSSPRDTSRRRLTCCRTNQTKLDLLGLTPVPSPVCRTRVPDADSSGIRLGHNNPPSTCSVLGRPTLLRRRPGPLVAS